MSNDLFTFAWFTNNDAHIDKLQISLRWIQLIIFMARVLQPTREYHGLNGIIKSLVCSSSLWTQPRHCLKQLPWLLTPSRRKHEELFPQRLILPESKGYVPILSPTQVCEPLINRWGILRGNKQGHPHTPQARHTPVRAHAHTHRHRHTHTHSCI